MKLLCLSNGHGEDAIAVRILRQLRQLSNCLPLAVLPLVGEGYAYRELNDLEVIGTVKKMPSGGFIYMDGREFFRDVKGGLLQLTLHQLKMIRYWAKSGGVILAVGDIVPLFFAWLSGANYLFVGTAKSEYYLRDESGPLPRPTWQERWEGWAGSVYLPWERWLMRSSRCLGVFPRDSLTTKQLQKFGIAAYDLGNPMMDDLEIQNQAAFYNAEAEFQELNRPLIVLLLAGSRPPEAYNNWQKIMVAVEDLAVNFPQRNLVFLVAVAKGLNLDNFTEILFNNGWQQQEKHQGFQLTTDSQALKFAKEKSLIILSSQSFSEALHKADFAVGMAGTATEQFVGLGKPVFTFSGEGPQFTPAFAEAQSRLLGPSVILLTNPQQIGNAAVRLLSDPDRLFLIDENGRNRMGRAGAARRIAQQIMTLGKF